MESVLLCKDIEKYYGNRANLTKALDGVSFEVERGEFVAIMGASGSGKTTLLNCISTIDRASAGHIYVGGVDITTFSAGQLSEFRRDQLGFVFQDANLLDTLTGYENIALALTIMGEDPKKIDAKVHGIAQTLSITDVLDHYPHQMSGGQRQRVASARAMVKRPQLILADEPTGALDSKSARALLESLSMMNHQLEATILMVTHDAFAASYCSRVTFIKDGKLFTELRCGSDDRKAFFDRIIETVAFMGGE
jgi:putative ABC transport system ATP-binding protein